MTRFITFSFLLLLGLLPCAFGGPAFSALRLVEAQPYGRTSQVLEITGERGDPLPREWLLLLKDSSARRGVREVAVANGTVSWERTPLRETILASELEPLDSSNLSFDADRVFQVVEREAVRSEIGFHWIDYTLRKDSQSNIPVWDIKIYDRMGATVGSMRLSAQSGAIIKALQIDPDAYSRAETPSSGSRLGNLVGNAKESTGRAVTKAKDATLRFMGSVQEVITGERTISPQEEEE